MGISQTRLLTRKKKFGGKGERGKENAKVIKLVADINLYKGMLQPELLSEKSFFRSISHSCHHQLY
jgi:hypothetical protein